MAITSSSKWVAVVPSNTVDLPDGPTKGIYIGGAGNLVADSAEGQTSVSFVGLTPGVIHPIRVKRVRTATTATNILAIY